MNDDILYQEELTLLIAVWHAAFASISAVTPRQLFHLDQLYRKLNAMVAAAPCYPVSEGN